jgi:hypothetical protein
VEILEGLRWKNVATFYGHLGYFMTIWYMPCPSGTFLRFWYHVPGKIWQPCFQPRKKYLETCIPYVRMLLCTHLLIYFNALLNSGFLILGTRVYNCHLVYTNCWVCSEMSSQSRIARFFVVQNTKMRKYQMTLNTNQP